MTESTEISLLNSDTEPTYETSKFNKSSGKFSSEVPFVDSEIKFSYGYSAVGDTIFQLFFGITKSVFGDCMKFKMFINDILLWFLFSQ